MYSKPVLIISTIIFIIIIISNIIAYIIFILNEEFNFENNEIIYEIKSNLNGQLIYNLRIDSHYTDDEEILLLGQCEGTNEGCYCQNKLYNRTCSEDDLKQNYK